VPIRADRLESQGAPGLGSLARGTALSFGGEIGRIVIVFGYGILIARVLGAENYGVFFLGYTTFNLLALFSYCAVEDALMRFLGALSQREEQHHVRAAIRFAFAISVGLGILFGMLCCVFADELAARVFNKPELAIVLRWLSPGIPIFAIMTVAVTSLRGFRIIKPYVAVRKVLLPVLSVALAGVVLALGGSLRELSASYVLAISASTVVALGVLSSFLKRFEDAGFKRFESRKFGSYMGLAFVVNLLLFLFSVIDVGIVGIMRPSGELGIYFAAKRSAQMLPFLLMGLNVAFVPLVAHLHGGKHHDQLGLVFKTTARWMLSLGLPIFMALFFFSARILSLFGEEFVQGNAVLAILAAGYLAHVAVGSTGYILMMTGNQRLMVVNAVCIAGGGAVSVFFLTGRYGMTGAAAANTFVLLAANLVAVLQISLRLRMSPWSAKYACVVASGVAMATVLWFTGWIPGAESWAGILGRSLIGGIVYLLLIFRFGLEENERLFLVDTKKKLLQSAV
jgi:O-antigen/teichoic acid export membrane protein